MSAQHAARGAAVVATTTRSISIFFYCFCWSIRFSGMFHRSGSSWQLWSVERIPQFSGARVATQFLSQFNLPRAVTAAIAQRRGADTERCMRDDPFFEVLTAYPGARFADAERLASALRADRRSPMRVSLALLHCLRYAASQGGHSFLPWLQLEATTRSFLAQTGLLRPCCVLVTVCIAFLGMLSSFR